MHLSAQSKVSIKGKQFLINGKPTYEGRNWKSYKIEGLPINSQLVQGVFDDLNPESAEQFAYHDTNHWDAQRNNAEFVCAMREWKNIVSMLLRFSQPGIYGMVIRNSLH
ncbi:hypothetical protein C7460_11019 [Marinoscillum furvescens DSM 4134]|uniref:Uncharacterized protein n=2 Tax=Marinoscillum furvescens TaxID=1026 RepID=A0A3D9L298_MARFU|nr:hypothetical protein C7460_11019 [Marinoscillum furvescens DSM 4134]